MRSQSHSVKSPFDHDAEKCCKQSRSQERKRYNRGGSCSMKSPFDYGAEKCRKQEVKITSMEKIQEKLVMFCQKSI